MSDESSSHSPVWRRSHRIKRIGWIALGVAAILVGTVLVVPQFVDLGLFKHTYLPRVEEALNRRLDVGEVRLSFFPAPSIRLSKLKVFETAGAADQAFFATEQVQLRLKLWPLLNGRFEVSELLLDKPIFNLLKRADGASRDSDLAGKQTPQSNRRSALRRNDSGRTGETVPPPLLIPGNMRIRDGEINISTGSRAPIRIKGIDLSLREFSGSAPFPFRASFHYPELRTVSLEGKLRYYEERSSVELQDNFLQVQGLTLPMRGNIGNLSGTPRVNINLRADNVDAKPVFQILSVFGLAPRDTEVAGPMGLTIDLTGPSTGLTSEIRGRFADVQVHGKRALRGHLSGDVWVKLPAGPAPVSRRLQGNGHLVARDGELTNVDMIRKIERVTGTIGMSKDERHQATTFQKLEADFVIGGGYADFTRVYLINPQMEITGRGTMTLEQPTLDMAVNTALAPQASARAGRGRVTSFFRDRQGRIIVPLRVAGPLENPSVNLNAAKLAETGMPQEVEKGFSSFFKRLFRSR